MQYFGIKLNIFMTKLKTWTQLGSLLYWIFNISETCYGICGYTDFQHGTFHLWPYINQACCRSILPDSLSLQYTILKTPVQCLVLILGHIQTGEKRDKHNYHMKCFYFVKKVCWFLLSQSLIAGRNCFWKEGLIPSGCKMSHQGPNEEPVLIRLSSATADIDP